MKRALTALASAALLAGCVSIDVQEAAVDFDREAATFDDARVRACPAHRRQDNARSSGPSENVGVAITMLAETPLARDPERVVRMRRIDIQPGGTIAWHSHAEVQGMAYVVRGEMTEFRNSCLDLITYRAGDIAIEDAGTQHGWRNDSDQTAVVLVVHEAPR